MYSTAPIYFGFSFVPDNSYYSFNHNHFEENQSQNIPVSYVDPVILVEPSYEPSYEHKTRDKPDELRETIDSESGDDSVD
jgi:hypothetical protein